jgi:polar amino acid transport system substrate-binding protein
VFRGFVLRSTHLYQKVILLCCLLLSCNLQAQESYRITTGEWPPYLSENLPHNGFMARIITESFALEDITVQWQFFPWPRAMVYARSGKAEATAIWRFSEKRNLRFLYSDPIIESGNVFFHLKKRPFDWQTLDDLKGLTIGSTSSYLYGEAFEAAVQKGIFTKQTIPSEESNFKKLLRGKIDLLPSNKFTGNHILKFKFSPKQAAKITYHPKFIEPQPLHLLFSRMSGNSKYFAARFNAGLEKLKLSGKFDEYLQSGLPK